MMPDRTSPPGKPPANSRRTPGQRAGLTREEVLRCALGLAEAQGLERLSMRRVAGELGVAPNALYTYFPDKTALLDGMFDAILGEIEPVAAVPARWQDSLADLMRASRRLVLAHPHLATLFLTRPGGTNSMRLGEATLRILSEGGVEGKKAVTALRVLLTYTLGFAAMEVPRMAEPEASKRTRRAWNLIHGLDSESYGTTRGLASSLASHPGEEDFEAGLRWLIYGIESR